MQLSALLVQKFLSTVIFIFFYVFVDELMMLKLTILSFVVSNCNCLRASIAMLSAIHRSVCSLQSRGRVQYQVKPVQSIQLYVD